MNIVCTACGTQIKLPDDPGSTFISCPQCKKWIRAESRSVAPVSSPLSETLAVDDQDNVGFDSTAISNSPKAVARPPHSKTHIGPNRHVLIAAAIGVTLVIGAIVALMMIDHQPSNLPVVTATPATAPTTAPSWETSHHDEILTAKASADAEVVAGNFTEAYAHYQQLLKGIEGHPIQDLTLLAAVTATRETQDKLLTRIIESHRRQPTTVATAPPAKPAPGPIDFKEDPFADFFTAAAPATAPASPTTVATVQNLPIPEIDPAAKPNPNITINPVALRSYTLQDLVTDKQVGDSILRGIQYLKSQFRNGQIIDETNGLGPQILGADIGNNYTSGLDCLAVYALLHAGQAVDDKSVDIHAPFAEQMLNNLKRYNLRYTYHRSLRAAALAVYNRPEDYKVLEEDVAWLMQAQIRGGYTYSSLGLVGRATLQTVWDNSNSQYGLLGVWSGAQAGVPVPDTYWKSIEQHWLSCQLDNGQWPYCLNGSGTLSMTSAGIASLLVTRENLDASVATANLHRLPPSPSLTRGLNWLETGDNSMSNIDRRWVGYTLYGLERIGLASGFKYFGTHDWYAEIARQVIASQNRNGSFGNNVIDTSYALLFLSRGRHPILFNKLRYDGNWDNRPHDIQNLARFASTELERPLNWQVISLKRSWYDWMDSPVLYISGDAPILLGDAEAQNIRDFALAGGLIFTHADGGSATFTRSIESLVRKIFPKYELTDLPKTHEIYTVNYHIPEPRPPLRAVSNGSRLLLLHSDSDLSANWQMKWTNTGKTAYQVGMNVFIYAAGKANFRNRLESPYIPESKVVAISEIPVARLRFAGEWDPEPYAWTRFSRYFEWETGNTVRPIVVDLKSLDARKFPIASLTGTVRYDFTDAETAAAREFVTAGGILVIDSAGGAIDFRHSIERTFLPVAFPNAQLIPLLPTHAILHPQVNGADNITKLAIRPFATEKVTDDSKAKIFRFGKGYVLYSPIDLSTGLLGTNSWGITGYDPAYCLAIMKNLVLSASHSKMSDEQAPNPNQ